MQSLRLNIEHVTKTFPGVKALSDMSLRVRPGEVHALLGENGAGKSTLLRTMSGVVKPDSGTIAVDGEVLTLRSPARRASRRDRHDPSGTAAGSRADRRAEHVPRPLAAPGGHLRRSRDAGSAKRPRRWRKLDPAIRPDAPIKIAEGGAAPDRRDRSGSAGERHASSRWTSRRRA